MTWNPDELEDRIRLKMISWVVFVFLSFASSEKYFRIASKLDIEYELILYANQNH